MRARDGEERERGRAREADRGGDAQERQTEGGDAQERERDREGCMRVIE